jgi:molybdopterin adenylyltransferase
MAETDRRYTCGVVTMSDKGARGEREDTSGAYLKELLSAAGFELAMYTIVPDNRERIVQTIIHAVDELKISLIVTTGGTGLSPTDVTPEAMQDIFEKEVAGMAEAMRAASLQKTSRGMLSRGRAGIRGQSLIINLPGSLKAVKENIEVVLPVIPHALDKIMGDPADCGTSA